MLSDLVLIPPESELIFINITESQDGINKKIAFSESFIL